MTKSLRLLISIILGLLGIVALLILADSTILADSPPYMVLGWIYDEFCNSGSPWLCGIEEEDNSHLYSRVGELSADVLPLEIWKIVCDHDGCYYTSPFGYNNIQYGDYPNQNWAQIYGYNAVSGCWVTLIGYQIDPSPNYLHIGLQTQPDTQTVVQVAGHLVLDMDGPGTNDFVAAGNVYTSWSISIPDTGYYFFEPIEYTDPGVSWFRIDGANYLRCQMTDCRISQFKWFTAGNHTIDIWAESNIYVIFDHLSIGYTGIANSDIAQMCGTDIFTSGGSMPGGWPACGTVDNPDFDTSGDWTLQGSASISGSVLDLPTTGASAYQPFPIVSNFYTVTIVARRMSSGGTDGLVVAIAPPDGSTGHVATTDPILIVNDGDYHTKVATIRPDTTGNGTLHIVSNGAHKVDYICLQPGYGENKCTSTSQIFDFEEGYNVDSSFISFGWGYSQHWRGIEYPLGGYSGGRAPWQCGAISGCGFATASMFAAHQQATIRYDYMVVPQMITVTAAGAGSTMVEILTSPDGENWSSGGAKAYASPGVVTFTLDYAAPVYVAVASLADTGINLMNMVEVDQVEMTGCYAGPNTFSGCIVGDPDLDVSDGYPSRFYWDGDYDAVAGAAALHPDAFIAQALTPPWVGQYNLEVVGSSTDAGCVWRVMFTNYGSGVKIAESEIPCTRGTNVTYSLPFSLPADPLMIWIEQRAGISSISRVCLTPVTGGASQCLNQNPNFDSGTVGYVGQPRMVLDAGDARLSDDYALAAVDVRYSSMPPPYALQLIASPRTAETTGTLTINNGSMPGFDSSDTDYAITQTTSLTYDIPIALPGNTGPMLWNYKHTSAAGGDFLIAWYCITRSVVLTQYIPPTDPFTCSTVTNANFTAGLDGWTANSDVLAVNGVASFAGGGQLSQQLSSFDLVTSTVRWLTRAYAPTAITLTVASDYGIYDFSHSLLAGGGGFYQETAPISGATAITVTSGQSGLELDFICLYPGNTAPPLITGTITGTVNIPPGGQLAQCIAPPMGILPNNMTSTLASLWPWGTSPTYYEILMIYNTAWVRFIGCKLDEYITWMKDDMWGKSLFEEVARGRCIVSITGVTSCGLRGMLDIIISLLALTALINAISALAQVVNAIDETLGEIVRDMVDTGRTLLYLFGLVGLVIAALIGLLILLATLILLIWQIPQEFWTSFRNAATGTDMVALPLPSSTDDPLYNIIVGLQLINQVAGATFLYPVVVIAIVVGSIGILLWTIRQFSVKV